jgi:hypothetical protein
MMFLTISSCSGPSLMPNSPAMVRPGKIADLVRRKNSPDSRSSTTKPNGLAANQPSWPSKAAICSR